MANDSTRNTSLQSFTNSVKNFTTIAGCTTFGIGAGVGVSMLLHKYDSPENRTRALNMYESGKIHASSFCASAAVNAEDWYETASVHAQDYYSILKKKAIEWYIEAELNAQELAKKNRQLKKINKKNKKKKKSASKKQQMTGNDDKVADPNKCIDTI